MSAMPVWLPTPPPAPPCMMVTVARQRYTPRVVRFTTNATAYRFLSLNNNNNRHMSMHCFALRQSPEHRAAPACCSWCCTKGGRRSAKTRRRAQLQFRKNPLFQTRSSVAPHHQSVQGAQWARLWLLYDKGRPRRCDVFRQRRHETVERKGRDVCRDRTRRHVEAFVSCVLCGGSGRGPAVAARVPGATAGRALWRLYFCWDD